MADQSDDGRNNLTLFKLPDGAEFPGFFTGGDGGFSVVALFDDAGAMVSVLTEPLTPHSFRRHARGDPVAARTKAAVS